MQSLFDSEELDELTVCRAASPVSPPRLPVRVKARKTHDGSGLSFCDWCANFGPCTCWQRTLAGLLRSNLSALIGSETSWRRQAISPRSFCLRPQILVQHISETDCGLWPTPRAGKLSPQSREDFTPNLPFRAMNWPTPTVQDGENSQGQSQEGSSSPPLNADVRLWPTMRSGDGATANFLRSPEKIKNGDDRSRIEDAVALWPTPRAEEASHSGRQTDSGHQAQLTTEANGFPAFRPTETTSEVGLLLQVWTPPSCPVLNEKFCGWLMNYPPHWCSLSEDELVGMMLKSKRGGKRTKSKSATSDETAP